MMPIKNIKKLKRLYHIVFKKKSWNKLPKRIRTWDNIHKNEFLFKKSTNLKKKIYSYFCDQQ